MTSEYHEGARPPMPPTYPPRADIPAQPSPQPTPPPDLYSAAAPPSAADGLSSPLPVLLGATGFVAMMIGLFAPLATDGNPATALRVVKLPYLAPMLALVALVVATGVLCRNPRFLNFGRVTAPAAGLLLSAAIGSEVFVWGATSTSMPLANAVAAGTYFLIGGILLLSLSVLGMQPATVRHHQPYGYHPAQDPTTGVPGPGAAG